MPMTLNSLSLFLPSTSRSTSLISRVKTTIDNVLAWMSSANLLSLNQSKTEFLLIGLPQQLSKVSDPTLCMPSNVTITPTNSARVLLALFLNHLSLSQNISHPCQNHASYAFVTFVEYGTLSTIPLLKPSLRLSFIPRSTIVTLSISQSSSLSN